MNKKQFTVLVSVLILLALCIIFAISLNKKSDSNNLYENSFSNENEKTSNNIPINSIKEETTLVKESQTPKTDSQVPVCNIGYEKTYESKVLSEESPAIITNVEKKCDGNYYVTVDYLSVVKENEETGEPGGYENTNLKLRTFKVADNFPVNLVNFSSSGSDPEKDMPIYEYLSKIKEQKYSSPIFGRNSIYVRPSSTAPLFNLKVKNGIIVSLNEIFTS